MLGDSVWKEDALAILVMLHAMLQKTGMEETVHGTVKTIIVMKMDVGNMEQITLQQLPRNNQNARTQQLLGV